MKKIFIPTPLDETIELPTDVTHHVLHVFRHNMEKPITVTGSDNRCGTYQITEEIDHHSTQIIRRKMDNEITRFMPRKVVFDFSKVSFMDSAGIGLLIGRYKLTKMLGGITEIKNTSKSIEKVLEMSGITRIIPITQNGKVS